MPQAFEAISQVPQWWAKNFEGSAQHPGDRFTVRFGETFCNFKITEATPPQKIVWLVEDCCLHFVADKKEWQHTQVVFELQEKENGAAEVTMTHIGLHPGVECYSMCHRGWDQFIKGSLYNFITENKGQPE